MHPRKAAGITKEIDGMKTYRIVLALALLVSALAITSTAYAHPNLPGYCQMPDGTLHSGHCNDAQNAAGGHDTHLPALPGGGSPNSGNNAQFG